MQGLIKLFSKKRAIPQLEDFDPVIQRVDDPEFVALPLDYPGQVHYMPTVAAGDVVRKGQVVARSRIGNAVIASISGRVRDITSVWTAQSVHSPAIIIDNDGGEPLTPEEMFDGPVHPGKFEAAMRRLRSAGVAPPWALSGREWKTEGELAEIPKVHTVIITGICQETTELTSQLLLDQERDKVAIGLKKISTLVPGARICLTAPESYRSWTDEFFGELAELYYVPNHYFGRIQRELVAKILKKRIPNRDNYRNHGVIVLDLEYLVATVDAFDGIAPLTQKCITISGTGIDLPVTVRFPLGSSLGHILASQGLSLSDYTRPLIGGPMRGIAQFTDQTPITYYNGIHLVGGEIAPFDNIAPCINCGRCARVCPAKIQVHLVNRMVEFGQLDSAMELNPEACHECGLCAYVCPAERPIVQLFHFCNRDMVHGERVSWAAGGLT